MKELIGRAAEIIMNSRLTIEYLKLKIFSLYRQSSIYQGYPGFKKSFSDMTLLPFLFDSFKLAQDPFIFALRSSLIMV